MGVVGTVISLVISPPLGALAALLTIRVVRRLARRATRRWSTPVRGGQWTTAAALAFSHGANDAQKAVGVIAAVLLANGRISSLAAPSWVTFVCAGALTAGTALGGWRIIRTVGRGIYRFQRIEGLASTSASAAVIFAASLVGAPTSTSQVVTSSIVGVGGGRWRWRHVHWEVVRQTGFAWLITLPVTAVVLTFLGATLLNIAAGEPFSPAQVLWIHFFISAPFGIALGLDQATPGLMRLRPRPRRESIMTGSLKLTSGLVGLYMAICLDVLIYFGKQHYGSTAVGSSIGLTAFALMLVVAAYESRSVTLSVLVSETFDNRSMNWTAVGEIALAVMVTQMDLFNRLLGTVPLKAGQFGLALASAVLLLALWEIGKLIARRRTGATASAASHSSSASPDPVVAS